jgi:flagellar protein FliS
MNPHIAYKQQYSVSITRIDQVLALYDGAIDRLEQACAALEGADAKTALRHRVRAQLLVGGLASCLDLSRGELPINLLRLYEFAADSIREGTLEKLRGAINVLRILREGFQKIQPELARLERTGAIPGADSQGLLEVTA